MKEYLRQVSSFRPALKWAIAAEIIYSIGIGIFTLIFNLHIINLGYDPNTIGSLLAAGFAVTAIMLIPIGRYADVVGRRLTFLIGTAMVMIGILLITAFSTLPFLYAGEIFYSVGAAVVLTTGLPIVLSLTRSKEEETFAYSIITSMGVFAVGVGSMLGGFLADWIPGSDGAIYRPALYIGSIAVIVALIIRFQLPVPSLRREPGEAGEKTVISWWPSREVLKFIGYAGLVGLGFAFTIPFYNLMLEMEYGMDSKMIGLVVGAVQFVTFLGMFLVPFLEGKLGRTRGFGLFVMIGIAINVVMGFMPNLLLFIVLIFGYTFIYPVIVALVERHALSATRDSERSQHVAYRSVLRFFAFLIGGKLGGFTIAAGLTPLNFYITGGVLLVVFLYYFGVVRSIFEGKDEAKAAKASAVTEG